MDDKTTESANAYSTLNTFPPKLSLYTIESAASLIATGKIVTGKEWDESIEIRAKCQMLQEELRKVTKGWRSQITLASAIELVNYAFRNVKENHSDLYHEGFNTEITNIFMNDLFLCSQELNNDIDRIFIENRDTNPYREVLKDSIENIFSKYKDSDLYRKNLEDYISHTINTGISDPDLYCKELNARIDYLFRRNSENKDLYSCSQELKNNINRIFNDIKKSDPFRKGLESNIENIFSKYNGLDSYRKKLEAGIDHIFSIDNDLNSYRYQYADSLRDIFICKPFELTKPFYEIYYKLEHYYKPKKHDTSGKPYCKSCKLLEHDIVEDNLFNLCMCCVNGIPQCEKTIQKIYTIIKSTLNAEVDKFGIFVFPTDYFIRPDATKIIIQVRYEGIKAWLKHGFDEEIYDMFFNPVSEKPDVPSVEDSKDQPKDEAKKEEKTDPFAELTEKYIDQSMYMDCLTEQQYTAYSLRKEYNRSISDTARRMDIARQTVYDLLADAERNITNAIRNMNRKNSR